MRAKHRIEKNTSIKKYFTNAEIKKLSIVRGCRMCVCGAPTPYVYMMKIVQVWRHRHHPSICAYINENPANYKQTSIASTASGYAILWAQFFFIILRIHIISYVPHICIMCIVMISYKAPYFICMRAFISRMRKYKKRIFLQCGKSTYTYTYTDICIYKRKEITHMCMYMFI